MTDLVTMPSWLQMSETDITSKQMPKWLADYRLGQWDAFIKNGLPTRHDDRWKYTDFTYLTKQRFGTASKETSYDAIDQYRLSQGDSILLVFINGYFVPELSDNDKLPAGVIVSSMSDALKNHTSLVQSVWPVAMDVKKYPFACMNSALFNDGLFLYLPDETNLELPVHVLSIATDDKEFIAQPHHLMVLGKRSKLTLVEEYLASTAKPYMMNIVSTMIVNEDANLSHCKIQKENYHAVHMANTFVVQKKNSSTNFVNFSSGAMFSRDDLVVRLEELGADCKTSGFYKVQNDNQYIDHHVDIDHIAPRSNSDMLFKGTIDNKSRAVFNGRLHVEKDAQKILAHQANHNLLLSPGAEVYSKPELEIYADDVKCKHGATTGQLDQDALFYMRSRGIPYHEALNILLQGFAEEIMQRITHPGIKKRVLA